MSVGKIIGWGVVGLLVFAGMGIVNSYIHTAAVVATAPSRVITKTMETNNIINNYEWFHDVNAQYKSRVAQINEYEGRNKIETDKTERNRLAVELSALRQTCRDLAVRYNANATKSNRSIFMGTETPETLSMEKCG